MVTISPQHVDLGNLFVISARSKGGTLPACRSKKPADQGNTRHSHHVDNQFEDSESEGEYTMYNITHKNGEDPICIDLSMNGTNVMMELDTGSGLTIINEQVHSTIAPPNQLNPLQKSNVVLKTYTGEKILKTYTGEKILKTYTGEKIDILGTAQVVARYQGREAVLPVQVVKGEGGPNLLGRDWIYQLKVSVGSRYNLVNSETNPFVPELFERARKNIIFYRGIEHNRFIFLTRCWLGKPHSNHISLNRPRVWDSPHFLIEKLNNI